jgi:hypothetical protein
MKQSMRTNSEMTGTQIMLLLLTIGVVFLAFALIVFAVQMRDLNRTVEIFYRQQVDMADTLKALEPSRRGSTVYDYSGKPRACPTCGAEPPTLGDKH